MDKKIAAAIHALAAPLGLRVERTKDAVRSDRHAGALREIIIDGIGPLAPEEGRAKAEGIVFSRNRALQLHALLCSYSDNAKDYPPLHLLYAAGTDRHAKAYEQVIGCHRALLATVERQDDFRGQTISLVRGIRAPLTFFLVDDIVIIRPIDFSVAASLSPRTFVTSLRMAPHLTRCYTKDQVQQVPSLVRHESGLLVWRWVDGQCDWGYPLSLDGHLFATGELRAMAESIDFSAPNSLEKALQEFNDIFLPRFGACFDDARLVNLPVNRVQTETANKCGVMHEDALLDQWEKGMRMDHAALYGAPTTAAHEEMRITFVRR